MLQPALLEKCCKFWWDIGKKYTDTCGTYADILKKYTESAEKSVAQAPVAGYYDEELRLEASCSINKHCLTCTSFPSARFVNKWFLSEGKQDICVRG